MTYYKQTDPKWKDLIYADGLTYGKFGCFVTSLGMLVDKEPTVVAEILRNNKLFTNGLINDSNKAAQVLGLKYFGRSQTKPDHDCIAETMYYGSQHFFVVRKDGSRLDPLGSSKVNEYKIVSYRLFKREDEMIPKSSIEGRVYNADGKLLYWIDTPETITKYFEGGTGEIKPITDLIPVKEVVKEIPVEKIVEKEVIKEVPVEKVVEKVVEKEVTVPVYEEILVQPKTLGEALTILWNFIKGIKGE